MALSGEEPARVRPQDQNQCEAALRLRLVTADEAAACQALVESGQSADFAAALVARGLITDGQAARLRAGGEVRADHLPLVPGYEILEEIGRGGMGVVYRARHRTLDRIDAVKVLPHGLVSQEEYVQRFLREARAAGRLVHPNIVRVYDAGQTGETYYLAMEYVDGPSLDKVLRDEGRLTLVRAARLIAPISRALAHVHGAGLIHRDIKPSNILLTSDETPKLTDLGLARAAGLSSSLGAVTSSGQVLGTILYMAPEQMRRGAEIDGRTDIYALGCTLYQLLAGMPPFVGDSPLVVLRQHERDIPPLVKRDNESIFGDTRRLLRQMLAKRPEDRPASADAVAEVLEKIASEGQAVVVAPSKGPAESKRVEVLKRKPVRLAGFHLPRRPAVYGVVGGVALALAAVAGVLLWGRGGGPPATRPTGKSATFPGGAPGVVVVTTWPKRTTYVPEPADLKQRVIWGSECELSDGSGLAFGGHDQEAEDGQAHTRIKVGAEWKDIHEELRTKNRLQPFQKRTWTLRDRQKHTLARTRYIYFEGRKAAEEATWIRANVVPMVEQLNSDLAALVADLKKAAGLGEYEHGQVAFALRHLDAAATVDRPLPQELPKGVTAEQVKAMLRAQIDLEQAAEAFDAEPPPRAYSPIAYDPKTGLYVIFGGDHLDYLMNDTWVFDPRAVRWMQRHPPTAPSPRANHDLTPNGDGTLAVTGGYVYTSSTEYMSKDYADLAGDGAWRFDAAAERWEGGRAGLTPDSRAFHTGPFHPDHFLGGAKPDAASVEAQLANLPVNTWVNMQPPHRPGVHSESAVVLDPDRDILLRWAGAGYADESRASEVMHYHLATNRWELPFPGEFPVPCSGPSGPSFGLRPWPPKDTSRTYAYHRLAKKMLGMSPEWVWLYDPERGDWMGRRPHAHKELWTMADTSGRPILCVAGDGVAGLWGRDGFTGDCRLLRLTGPGEAVSAQLLQEGDPLPGGYFYASGLAHDAKRDRLLFFPRHYEKPYDGQVYSVDLKSLVVKRLDPGGMDAVARFDSVFVREVFYLDSHDLVLPGLASRKGPQVTEGSTLAYDGSANRWMVVYMPHVPPPAGARSPALVFDPKRRLVWATEAHESNVYVLRLDLKAAGMRPLESTRGGTTSSSSPGPTSMPPGSVRN